MALIFAACNAVAEETLRPPSAVWAIGIPNGYIMMEHQPSAITVTAADVACGVIDLRSGSRFIVTTGTPTRYAVRISNRGTVFRSVHIDGLRRAIVLASNQEQMLHDEVLAGRHEVTLNFRFSLARDLRPGTYAWPIDLTLHSIVQGNDSSAGSQVGAVNR